MDIAAIKQAIESGDDAEKEAMMQKLQSMAMATGYDKEKFLSTEPPHMRVRFESLHQNQEKVDEALKQFAAEQKALELKYRKICEPLYRERSQIVTGEVVPPGGEGEEVGIPSFWLKSMLNNDELAESFTEKDSKVLEHLVDIACSHYDGGDADADAPNGKHGFTLTFRFSPNEFFEETELTKTYLFQDEEQSVLMKTIGTDITWKSGKDPTIKVLKKKGKGGAPAKFKTEKVDSFFQFFDPPAIPDDGDEMEEDEEEALQESVEMDYEMGAAIKEKIIPMALKWYTGEAEADQGILSFGDDDEDNDDDEEDDDDGDDEDEDDDDDAPVAPPTDQKDAECKQQ